MRLKDECGLAEKNAIIDRFMNFEKVKIEKLSREELRLGLCLLASWFRDIVMIKTGFTDQDLINADRKQDLFRLGASFSFNRLYEIIDIIGDSLLYLEQNVNTRLILSSVQSELACVS